MFDQLVESQPARSRNLPQTIFSITAHTLIIAASIQLTRAAAESVVKRPVETPVMFARPNTPVTAAPATASNTPSVTTAPAITMPAVPTIVPIGIPPVDLSRGAVAPPQFGPPSGHDIAVIGDRATGSPDVVLAADQVDEPVQFLEGPQPVYPPALRRLGIEGSVTLRYIIGTDGSAEPGSVQVIQSSNRSFEEPAIEAIRSARFRPARSKGQVVRQLVEQVVRFMVR